MAFLDSVVSQGDWCPVPGRPDSARPLMRRAPDPDAAPFQSPMPTAICQALAVIDCVSGLSARDG
jgi:hypothetical protein